MADNDSPIHLEIPRSVFAIMLLGTLGLGAGGMGVLGPKLEKTILDSCIDNSRTALAVAKQHGQEILELRRLLRSELNREILESSKRELARDAEIGRRLQLIEREVDALGKGR